MSHSHNHGPANYDGKFALGIGLNLLLVVGQVTFGLRAHSLALVADGGHNASDALGLMFSWICSRLSRTSRTSRRTYGLRRSSILAALVNAVLLLPATGAISWEAVQRLRHPLPVASGTVVWVAVLGVVVNGVTAVLFMRDRKADINIRSAFLQMVSDALVSAGVVVAALVIGRTGWNWLDPALSLVIVAVIVLGTWSLLRESLDLILDAVPEGVNPEAVESYLRGIAGVQEIHDLHIWAMSTTEVALTVHLTTPDLQHDDAMLARLSRELHDRFGIEHATIQCERGGGTFGCGQGVAHSI